MLSLGASTHGQIHIVVDYTRRARDRVVAKRNEEKWQQEIQVSFLGGEKNEYIDGGLQLDLIKGPDFSKRK